MKNNYNALITLITSLLLMSLLINATNGSYNAINITNTINYNSINDTSNSIILNTTVKSAYAQNNIGADNITIFEHGLPNGFKWGILLNNTISLNATAPNSIALLKTGNYILSVPQLKYFNSIYMPNTSSINDIGINEINISYNILLNTNFFEQGLPNNSSWYVNYSNITKFTKANTIAFNVTSGNYLFLVPNVLIGNAIYVAQINKSYALSGTNVTIIFNEFNNYTYKINNTIATNSISNKNNSYNNYSSVQSSSKTIQSQNLLVYNMSNNNKNFIQKSLQFYNIINGSLLDPNLSMQNYTLENQLWVNNFTSINSQKINALKNYIRSKHQRINEINKTFSINYGLLKQNNKIVSAGKNLNFILYNNSTIIYYQFNIIKSPQNLSININGYNFSTPNATTNMYMPVGLGRKNYNLSISLNNKINQNNNEIYTYSIKFSNNTMFSGSGNYTNFNKFFRYNMKYNIIATITFGALGDLNYSAVDPTVVIIPVNILYYLPITITNNQNIATSTPFQQMISINSLVYKNYEAKNLDNIEFFYSNSTLVPSWLEGNSSYNLNPGASNISTNTIYWLKLNNILANSNVIVYMGFANHSTNLLTGSITGEAPTLSSTYGNYDNGNSIFNYYQSFGSLSSLPTPWQLMPGSGAGSFTSNYYEIGANVSTGGINTSIQYNTTKSLFEAYLTIPLTTGPYISGFGAGNKYFEAISHKGDADDVGGTTAGSAMVYTSVISNVSGSLQLYTNAKPEVGSTTYNGIPTVYGIGYNSNYNATYFFENYNNVFTDLKAPSHPDMSLTVVSNLTGEDVYWFRMRYMPPNEIMPSAALGTLFGVVRFSESGLPNSGELWNVTYDGVTENATVPNTIIFSDIPNKYAFTVPNQIVSGKTYTPNTPSGYVVTGNSTSIVFSQSSSSVCTISLNSNTINFGSINPNSSISTTNSIIDSNTGNANAYLYVFGGNWIGSAQSFGVSNTSYSGASGIPYSTASKLSALAVNTLLSVPSSGSNTIYFGFNLPKAIKSGIYNQTITIENSC